MADEEHKDADDHTPMPVFTAGERFKESLYKIGDITLFRPLSYLEIFFGIPLCALICYAIVYPILGGNWAIAIFVVAVYASPKALVWAEAKAGRPVLAELGAAVHFAFDKVMGYTVYQGMQRLGRFGATRNQHARLMAMLDEEDEAHAELLANRSGVSQR